MSNEQLTQETRERIKSLLWPSLANSVFGLPADKEIDDIIRPALEQAYKAGETDAPVKRCGQT